MRARFVGTPGWVEPRWPLVVRIYATPEQAEEHGDRAPRPFACWWKGRGVVNAAAFGERTMPMENVVQHELSHALERLRGPK